MSGSLGRRQFIRHATYGAAFSGVVSPRLRAGSANEQVVVGVMGMSRGRTLARGFAGLPGVVVKYVCDADIDRAKAAAGDFEKLAKPCQAVQDYRRILDDKEVDALACAAPNHWHAPATILGVNAGKHVYVEKPCSHNPWEGEMMVRAAHERKRAVQMGSQRRSGPGTIDAIAQLQDGVIGRVYLARGWYTNSRGTIGRGKPASVPTRLDYQLWQGPAPRTGYVDNRVHYNWHWFWRWGNGELGNNGVHTLDLCRWGLDVDYPIRVTSSGGRYRFEDDQETPDTHTVAFEFEGKRAITWQGTSCNRHGSGFVTFYGEAGTMALESNGSYTIYDAADKQVKTAKSNSRGDREHLLDFVDAIRQDQPLNLNAEIEKGHKSTLLCHLGNIAHRTGHTLNCDPENGRVLDDKTAMRYWKREYEPGWEPQV